MSANNLRLARYGSGDRLSTSLKTAMPMADIKIIKLSSIIATNSTGGAGYFLVQEDSLTCQWLCGH